MFRLTSVLFTVLLAAFAVTIPTSQVHAQPLWGSQHIAIPAYFAPSTDRADWDRTDQSSPTVRIVIINKPMIQHSFFRFSECS